MTKDNDDVLFDNTDKNSSVSGKKPDNQVNLPPIAQNGDVKVWLSRETDKNGDQYLYLEMPGHNRVPLFLANELQSWFNELVDTWKKSKKQG